MYLIRADGNAKIGAGHLMRCMTIGGELGKLLGDRERICFLCADEASGQLAREQGFRVCILGSGGSWPEEGSDIYEKINVILIDSYSVTDDYLREAGKYGHVTLLDDMCARRFPVDRIINYNAFADKCRYEKLYEGTDTRLVIGSQYIPLRPQFLNLDYTVREQVENVLITTGGGDSDNIAGRILERLTGSEISKKLNYHLIIGAYNPHYERMKALEHTYPNVHIYHKVENMAGLMRECDLAVTAGGTTIYELAAVGVPFVCFSYAENQEALTEYVGKKEIALSAGAYHREPGETLERILGAVRELCRNRSRRNMCYEKEREMVDGMGAVRLARILAGVDEGNG